MKVEIVTNGETLEVDYKGNPDKWKKITINARTGFYVGITKDDLVETNHVNGLPIRHEVVKVNGTDMSTSQQLYDLLKVLL